MSLFSKLKGTTDTQFSIGQAATQGFFSGDLKIDSIIPATLLNINGNAAITGVASPSFDSYTSLLLHMDGTDASTTFTDEIGHTITAVNHAQIDTAYYQFGTASGLFDGTDDSLTGPVDAHFDFGTGDFTVDFWLRFNGTTGQPVFYGGGTNYNNGLLISYSGGSGICLYYNGNFSAKSWNPSTAIWYHFAITRSGTSVRIFIDGSQVGTTDTSSDNLNTGQAFHIGGNISGANYFNGWLDEYRISKGIARWTANFTRPSSPYAPSGTAHTLTVSTLDGMLKGSSGVVGVASLADGMTYSANTLGNSYLDQSVKIAATPTFAGIIIADGGTVGQAAGPLMKFNDTSNYLNITGCKVGVGMFTSLDPISTLHVRDVNNSQGSLKYQLAIEDNTAYSGSPVSGISFRVKADATPNIYDVSGIHGGKENANSGDYAGFLSLHTRAAAGNNIERLRIKSDGKVGIACTPTEQFEVGSGIIKCPGLDVLGNVDLRYSSARTIRFSLTGVPNSGDPMGSIDFRDSSNNVYASILGYCDGSAGANDNPGGLSFYTTKDGESWLNKRMTINNAGSVEIGIVGSLGLLNNGEGRFIGTNANTHINYSTTEATYIRGGKTGASVFINDGHAGNVEIATGGGWVGIKRTPAANYALVVRSGSSAGIFVDNSGATRTNFCTNDDGSGFLYAATWTYSDKKNKENIVSISGDSTSKVKQLRPIKFDLKGTGAKGNLGFLAEEVQLIIPEAVAINPLAKKEGELMICHQFILPHVVQALQEIEIRITKLEKK